MGSSSWKLPKLEEKAPEEKPTHSSNRPGQEHEEDIVGESRRRRSTGRKRLFKPPDSPGYHSAAARRQPNQVFSPVNHDENS
jgi:hypothetical protein